MRDWIKVRKGWYEGLSHRRLGGDALHLGPCLMFLADATWQPGEDEGALLDPGTRKPLTLADICLEARWPKRRVEKALVELVERGTLAVRPDGAWCFPKYGRHQETPDARRKRKARKPSAESPGDVRGPIEAEAEEKQDRGRGDPAVVDTVRELRKHLEQGLGIPITEDMWVWKDAIRAVGNGDYTLDEIAQVLQAMNAGRLPIRDRLRVFQHQNRDAVRAAAFGEAPSTDRPRGPDDLPVYRGKVAHG